MRTLALLLCTACSSLVPSEPLTVEGATAEYSAARIALLLDCARLQRQDLHTPTSVVVSTDLPYAGLTSDPYTVHVRSTFTDGSPRPLVGSALLHEVWHAHLWQTQGDPDDEHIGDWDSVEQWSDEAALCLLQKETPSR